MAPSSPGPLGPTLQALPRTFVWGAATAAYQIEGAVTAGGRGPSIWDTFSHTPGAVLDGDTGDVAADHFHRWREDVDIMREMGLDAYRFSVAWPRIQPTGRGQANADGLAFYDRLIEALLDAGIKPYLTLYHWDLPQALQDTGGWTDRETALRFGDYAAILAERWPDQVSTWTTLNEPWCSAFHGYASGHHAPGHRSGAEALAAAHHLNLAHGLATQALRSGGVAGEVSITCNVYQVRASTTADEPAAHLLDLVANRVFLDPVLTGSYPRELFEATSSITDWSVIHDGDERTIFGAGQPPDTLGVNYYHPLLVRSSPDPPATAHDSPWVGAEHVEHLELPGPHTAMGWPIDASGLRELLLRLHRDYPGTPMVITENGAALADTVADDGSINDAMRVQYLTDHIQAMADAVGEGVDVRGYFVWSLMDNFEWAFGYSKRFGLIHVDYQTLQRRWKDSARWYRDLLSQWHAAGSDG
jgi:beta-glucosidase